MVGAKKIVVVIAAAIVVAAVGAYFGLTAPENGLSPAPDLDSGLPTTLEFSGMELNEETKKSIVSEVLAEITPYKGVKYDKVNISAMKNGEDHDLRVICFSDACEYPDVYDFTYYGISIRSNGDNAFRICSAVTTPIMHRAISWVEKGEEMTNGEPAPHEGYITRGDNNPSPDQSGLGIEPVRPEWVICVARLRIPYLGHLFKGIDGTVIIFAVIYTIWGAPQLLWHV